MKLAQIIIFLIATIGVSIIGCCLVSEFKYVIDIGQEGGNR